jgi:5,10-methylene-tetrahydrofolate dehydrogenase/methenyl tetrahydrofolate cyclohydrolase
VEVLPLLQRRRGYLGVSQLQMTREPGMKLTGKVTWVVGGSRGIGAAVARELASRGATVAVSAAARAAARQRERAGSAGR